MPLWLASGVTALKVAFVMLRRDVDQLKSTGMSIIFWKVDIVYVRI